MLAQGHGGKKKESGKNEKEKKGKKREKETKIWVLGRRR
jgi:hypothetical protein